MKYGIFGSITTMEGKRQEFISLLHEGIQNMPGCMKYDICLDKDDQNKLWIYEVWETMELHEQSLMLPSVQKAIQNGRSMISDFGSKVEFIPFIF